MPADPVNAEQLAITTLAALRNLGPVSSRLLVDAGFRSPEELRAAGAVEAFRRVVFHRAGQVSTNLLWALHGAITDERWDLLPARTRERLRHELDAGGWSSPQRRRPR